MEMDIKYMLTSALTDFFVLSAAMIVLFALHAYLEGLSKRLAALTAFSVVGIALGSIFFFFQVFDLVREIMLTLFVVVPFFVLLGFASLAIYRALKRQSWSFEQFKESKVTKGGVTVFAAIITFVFALAAFFLKVLAQVDEEYANDEIPFHDSSDEVYDGFDTVNSQFVNYDDSAFSRLPGEK